MPVFQPDIVESDHRPRLLPSLCRNSAGGGKLCTAKIVARAEAFEIALVKSRPAVLRAAGNNAIASTIMHLTCPQCQTEYDVPEAALMGRARTLRCGDCGTKFTAPALPEPALAATESSPEIPPQQDAAEGVVIQEKIVEEDIAAAADASFEPPAEAVEPAEPETETVPPESAAPLAATRTMAAPPKSSAPPPPAPKPNRALGVSVLVVLLLIGIVLAEHRAIGHAWPPSLRLFNALGLR
jgi:predicted Zn finger-like uncharacterized protein